jgi:116 kDa U5 small nuclear ribonucleoprotein component
MDDLYDEFGNFIGEDGESSEAESGHAVDAPNYVDEESGDDAPEATGQELMEIDGMPQWPLLDCSCCAHADT